MQFSLVGTSSIPIRENDHQISLSTTIDSPEPAKSMRVWYFSKYGWFPPRKTLNNFKNFLLNLFSYDDTDAPICNVGRLS